MVDLLGTVAAIGLIVGAFVLLTGGCGRRRNPRPSMRTLTRVCSLDNAASIFKMSATGNRYYPGQDDEGLKALTGGKSSMYPNCQSAGSALLARALFTDPNGAFPVSAYGKLEDGLLDTSSNPVTGVPYSILDVDSETMAIL